MAMRMEMGGNWNKNVKNENGNKVFDREWVGMGMAIIPWECAREREQ